MKRNSKLFRINRFDILKSFVTAVLSSLLTSLYKTLELGKLPTDWKTIVLVALSSGVAYLLKQFFTNSEGLLTLDEPQNSNKYKQ